MLVSVSVGEHREKVGRNKKVERGEVFQPRGLG